MYLQTVVEVESAVRQAVAEVTVTDIHTHLFPPNHGPLLLWGIDEQLTYHYLVAELFMDPPAGLTPQVFYRMPKSQQADLVWQQVFLRHGGLSEAAQGLLTSLAELGLDLSTRDLPAIRRWFAEQNACDFLNKAFNLANIDYAVMTNDPFNANETQWWQGQPKISPRLKTALRMDALLNWSAAAAVMAENGFEVAQHPSAEGFKVAQQFLLQWAAKLHPVYLAISLPPTFAYPSHALDTQVVQNIMLPVARQLGIPVALMIGVKKAVNPALGLAGDGVGTADLSALQHLCSDCSDVKFISTVLSATNQHELCVLSRKFGNLHIEGCWWFCNQPSLIRDVTTLRMEMLGATFTCQHSDARVLDQVIYKWKHTRRIVADVLAEKYRLQFATGWRVSEDEIRREVRSIFGGAFEAFCSPLKANC